MARKTINIIWLIISLGLFASLVSCNQNQSQPQEINTPDSLNFKFLELSNPDSYNDFLTYHFRIPFSTDTSTGAILINKTIQKTVFDDDSNLDKLETLIHQKMEELYQEVHALNENLQIKSSLPYEYWLSGEVVRNDRQCISIVMDNYYFSGGAHGNSNITALNFNPKTGQKIEIYDLIPIDKQELFRNVVLETLKIKYSIPLSADIEENGFLISDSSFTFANNILFQTKKLKLIYQPYEIGPYSLGAIQIEIPIESIKHLFHKDQQIYKL
jgi:hypothetical protein